MEKVWRNCPDCEGEGGDWEGDNWVACGTCEGEEGHFGPVGQYDNAVAGPEANTLRCEHCGMRLRLKMPMAVELAAEVMRAFAALHQFCHVEQMFVVEGEHDER